MHALSIEEKAVLLRALLLLIKRDQCLNYSQIVSAMSLAKMIADNYSIVTITR